MNRKSHYQQQQKYKSNQKGAPSLSGQRRSPNEFFVTCYGAGSEVGRSCILVEMSGKRILLDCGVNIGTTDPNERLPKFPRDGFDIDLVLISHIHNDHLCSLPLLTKEPKYQKDIGMSYKGPIYMSKASLALAPIMLQDFIQVTDNPPFKSEDISFCIEKIQGIEFGQRILALEDKQNPSYNIYVQAFPAGHLLGAVAFYVTCNGRSFLYTGDFSGAADHHLSGHQIPCLYPDLLITESTYGDLTREPMYKREKSFVQMVHRCVSKGGKVLIPVFAVGRLQEILLMLNDYWERMQCPYPIYFASLMGAKAIEVYKLATLWMNPTVQNGFFDLNKRSMNFSGHVSRYDPARSENQIKGACVMVATSGMLNNGCAKELFVNEKWYDSPKNLIIFPGYCGQGTLGHAVLNRDKGHVVYEPPSKDKDKDKIEFDVKCQVEKISFSAHADQFEIISMCERLKPKKALCIHGDRKSVKALQEKIHHDMNIVSKVAENCELLRFFNSEMIKVRISRDCLDKNQPSMFSGAVILPRTRSEPYKVIPSKSYAHAIGAKARKIIVKRRVQTNASFNEIVRLLIDMELLNEDELAFLTEGATIETPYFSVEFTETCLLISYEPGFNDDDRNLNKVNEFCCLVSI